MEKRPGKAQDTGETAVKIVADLGLAPTITLSTNPGHVITLNQ